MASNKVPPFTINLKWRQIEALKINWEKLELPAIC